MGPILKVLLLLRSIGLGGKTHHVLLPSIEMSQLTELPQGGFSATISADSTCVLVRETPIGMIFCLDPLKTQLKSHSNWEATPGSRDVLSMADHRWLPRGETATALLQHIILVPCTTGTQDKWGHKGAGNRRLVVWKELSANTLRKKDTNWSVCYRYMAGEQPH